MFKLYLPTLAEPAPVADPPQTDAPSAVVGAKTILVVDDEETLLRALSFILVRHGFTVIKARDGVEAVEGFTRNAASISLVLLDLGLPRLSGWEAFLKIKEHSLQVNAVIMSGHLESNLKTEILRAVAKGYLQNPFALNEAIADVGRFYKTET